MNGENMKTGGNRHGGQKQPKKSAQNTPERIQRHDPSSSNWPLADIDAKECAQLRIFLNNGSSFSASGDMYFAASNLRLSAARLR
jgi:hypothetical protein